MRDAAHDRRQAAWVDPSRYVRRLFIERAWADHPYARDIVARAGLPVSVVDEREVADIVAGTYPDNLDEGKSRLLLSRNLGPFLKDCPSTREYRCCGYRILNVGLGCPMDCVYCILQAYLNTPNLVFYINLEDLFTEMTEAIAGCAAPVMRIGTGEFTDSLALDRITGLSARLVAFFAAQNKAVLELKTKCGYVDNLRGLDHRGRTIVAWSLNSRELVATHEFRAASLLQRLEAAARCVRWGYDVAFHFDPIIAYDGWEQGYTDTIRLLFEQVPADAVAWISLGGFRYLPSLRATGLARFPRSPIFSHEFIEGLDGKKRYFRSMREEMYKRLYDSLASRCGPRTCIYFCMESDEIWRAVTGFTPAERGGLPAMLDRAACR